MPSMAAVVRMYVKIDETAKSWVCNRCTAEAEAAGKDPVQKTFSLTGGTSNIVRHFREYHEEVFRPNAEWTKEFPHGGVTTKIHDYYDVIDVNLYSCTLCQKQVKASTSANLLLHFRTTHQAAYDEYLKLSGKRKKRRTEEHRVEKYRDGGEPAQKLFKGDVVEEEPYEWQESTLEDHEYVEDSSAKIIHLGEEIEEEPAEEIVSVVKAADDPLKMFFLTMYESVKRLPKKDIFQVRRRIFDLVCESEEQQHYEDVEEHPRKD